MPHTLLLRLEAPIQSWSNPLGGLSQAEHAVPASQFGSVPTQPIPTKSGVLGLAAAALGIARGDDLSHLSRLTFGVRTDRAGIPMDDLQTRPKTKRHTTFGTAPDGRTTMHTEVRLTGDQHISYHVQLHDASFLAGLEGDRALLGQIMAALQDPHWPLYLGRRSQPPAVPIWMPGGLLDEPLVTALSVWPFGHRIDEVATYHVERRAAPADQQVREVMVWDEPAPPRPELHPLGLRRFQLAPAVRWDGLWGQVFGPQSAATPPTPKGRMSRAESAQLATRHREETKTSWTEAELRAEGRALYESGEWFRAELRRLGTLAAMEHEHGYSNQVLSKWAARHGVSLRPHLSADQVARIHALRAEGLSAEAVAREVGVSKASVLRHSR